MHRANAVEVRRDIRQSTLGEVCLSEITADVNTTARDA